MSKEKDYSDQTEMYLDVESRNKVALDLLFYARILFSRVYVFQNFDIYSRSFEFDPLPKEYWEAAFYERLIDKIKICTSFENYNKAVLLSNGILIHKINPKSNKKLASLQQSRTPVLIDDFLLDHKYSLDYNNEWSLDGLRKNFETITFSDTLAEHYQRVIGLDKNFIHYLKEMNIYRNRLHLYKNYAGASVFRVELEKIAFAKNYGLEQIEKQIESIQSLV